MLSIGGSEGVGPTEFSGVRGIARLSDGRIAVANGATAEIRVFGAQGTLEHSMGRSGAGPGEFTRLQGLLRSGDTLIGIDGDGRAQVFLPDGALVRSLRPARRALARNPQRLGILPDGTTFVTVFEDSVRSRADAHEVTLTVTRSTLAGDSVVALVRLKAYRVYTFAEGPAQRLLDAHAVVTARAGRFCGGFSDRFDVTCYDQTGKPVLRLSRQVKREAVNERDRNIVRTAYLAANREAPESIRRQMERAVLTFPFAELRPVFSRLVLSTTGDLWVGPFDPGYGLPGPPAPLAPNVSQRWNMYAADGVWLADVVLPPRFVAMEMGRDYVAGVAYDEDDIERVMVLRVRR